MNYSEAIGFLYNQLPVYHRVGKAAYKANLDNTLKLDSCFDSPHRKFRSVHIAGTNGKGSVSHMLASVLQEAGVKTGLYTSPHLKDFRERIRINGSMIPESEVIDFVTRNRHLLDEIRPSFFEMSVAMAFDYFAREETEVVVVETGLGGRLDSTNIITPLLSIITNIGYDHMDLLGDTLPQIASEKAGIIKEKVPVIIGESDPETDGVFMRMAGEKHSDILFADKIYSCDLSPADNEPGGRRFAVTGKRDGGTISGIAGLTGDYQEKNLPVVVTAFGILKDHFSLDEDDLRNGIRNVLTNTGLQGRWQTIGQNPVVICDTGHNGPGLKWVIRQLKSLKAGKIHFVIGFVNDKDLSLVLPLFPKDSAYYFTRAQVPRALDQDILRTHASEYGLAGNAFGSVAEALAEARRNAAPGDVVFVGGSTFIVAEVL